MVKDIAEIFSAIQDLVKDDNPVKISMTFKPKKSLSRKAMDGIANFSVVVDNLLTPDEAMMVARSLEKRFASFLVVAMSMDPTFDLSNGDLTMADYLRQFHQNIDTSSDLIGGTTFSFEGVVPNEKLLETAESLGLEYKMFATEAAGILCRVYEKVNSTYANMEAAKLNFTIEDVTESSVLNNTGRAVLEADYNYTRPANPSKRDAVADSEFKKANDVVPTLLHVRVFPTGINQTAPIDFIIGVQATVHPVKSSDIILNLVRGLRNDDAIFNFIRWTTGETKFVKDFLLALDQTKIEASTSSGSSNELFAIGRRQKALSKIKNLFNKTSMMPNLTVVVTTDTLVRMKEEYGYDITMSAGSSQVSLIRKLMTNYFMLGFVIVDPGLQRVHIITDGKTQFDSYTYANLQKEGTVNDRQFKEMMKMLGRSV